MKFAVWALLLLLGSVQSLLADRPSGDPCEGNILRVEPRRAATYSDLRFLFEVTDEDARVIHVLDGDGFRLEAAGSAQMGFVTLPRRENGSYSMRRERIEDGITPVVNWGCSGVALDVNRWMLPAGRYRIRMFYSFSAHARRREQVCEVVSNDFELTTDSVVFALR